MRPRVFPAEDTFHERHFVTDVSSFNEAAGIPRGRQRLGLLAVLASALLQ